MEDGVCTTEEYHVRTIRGGDVHLIWKLECTWGKRSSKSGDFGWLKRIPAWTRTKWRVSGEPPPHLKTTKLAAIRHELKTAVAGDFDTDEAFEKAKKTLKSMESRARSKRTVK
ncbi:hypothetical protein G6M87_11065 [Rhizobium rhizogenes]|nr:hypothetical protein [Rhizobium rhizogenes]QTG07699.1 hypothetical protein G6M87_11065 [Rhizobium rhizogenes]